MDTLVKTAAGWQLTTRENLVENYDATGRLLSVVGLDGLVRQSFFYDASGSLSRMVDPFGRQLKFAFDTSNRIATITSPADGIITYGYDTQNNLASVTYPDDRSKTYHYENPSFPHALTGITDENGLRFATYRYDSQGRAYDEDHGGSVDHYNLVYGNNSTTVTDP